MDDALQHISSGLDEAMNQFQFAMGTNNNHHSAMPTSVAGVGQMDKSLKISYSGVHGSAVGERVRPRSYRASH
jgi:hypothetical protein